MTKSRIFSLFPLFILLLVIARQVNYAQTLPANIRSSLSQSYSSWGLDSDDPICKTGDFDGNKKTDYAVMFVKGRSGYIVAFLANGTDYKAIVLESDSSSDMKNSFLSVARKGQGYAGIVNEDLDRGPTQKLKNDAIVSGGCESSEYLYIYNNGRFKQVFTSD